MPPEDQGNDDTGDAVDEQGEDTGADAPADLGDAGKKALRAERKAKRDEARARKAAEDRVTELEAQIASSQTADDREAALDAARREADKAAREEVAGEYRSRILSMELRIAAKGKLADPDDAISLIDLSEYDADDDDLGGTLSEAVDQLLEAKPYLAAGEQKSDKGSADGGAKPPAPIDENLSPNERLRRAYSNN